MNEVYFHIKVAIDEALEGKCIDIGFPFVSSLFFTFPFGVPPCEW